MIICFSLLLSQNFSIHSYSSHLCFPFHTKPFCLPLDKNMGTLFETTQNLCLPASPSNLCLLVLCAHLQVKGCIYQPRALQLKIGILPCREERAACSWMALCSHTGCCLTLNAEQALEGPQNLAGECLHPTLDV